MSPLRVHGGRKWFVLAFASSLFSCLFCVLCTVPKGPGGNRREASLWVGARCVGSRDAVAGTLQGHRGAAQLQPVRPQVPHQ